MIINRAAVIGQLKQIAGACFATLRARRKLGEADEVTACRQGQGRAKSVRRHVGELPSDKGDL
jgi:hypothetical protein